MGWTCSENIEACLFLNGDGPENMIYGIWFNSGILGFLMGCGSARVGLECWLQARLKCWVFAVSGRYKEERFFRFGSIVLGSCKFKWPKMERSAASRS